ncbi:DUF3732 domain-containing protein [Streptomyces niveus]|uniref:DUF3732 domain-containing protein n=1 Tax=Streptomyces niveus TaxID=193462 RepID=A0A1U9QWW3_STRNV|nr:DUF3732 domain-containing protein [Streptomyces niveus]AQU68734.1 hypothetical protein BBN63_23590 [Streptomyces niveus]
MTFQIRAISIYNRDGEMRTVPFQAGSLNIITGDSRRGKSAILTIVDYCLGSDDFVIRGAALRNFVHVFALTIIKGDEQLFVARPAPVGKAATNTTFCVVSQALGAPPPDYASLTFSMPLDIAKKVLSRFTSIDLSVQLPVARSPRQLSPSVRHGLFFCLQEQNEVANQDLLFHGQMDDFHRSALRAMLPYFLGTVDPERAQLEHRLRLLRRQLAEQQERLSAARPFEHASGTAAGLHGEALEVNLLAPAPAGRLLSHNEIVDRLRQAVEAIVPGAAPPAGEDPLSVLNVARRDLRQAYSRTRVRISNLKTIAKEKDDFLGQVREQHARLATLGLLRRAHQERASQDELCPVCGSRASEAGQVARVMRRDLERLDAEMSAMGEATPDINARIVEEEAALADLRSALARNQEQIEVLSAGQRAAAQDDPQHRTAVVQGRISLFLDTMTRHAQVRVEDRREEIAIEIASLEEQLGNSAQEDLLSSHLSLVNQKIQAKAVALELEHHNDPIRLDPRALTLIADTRQGPVKMSEMGSGHNYLGYHIATMLSLHEWFNEIGSPVPRFLILDQPSQAGFPDETRGGGFGSARATLLNLYETIHASIESLAGAFQVIVLEHADLDEEPFRSAVRARWRRGNGEALVPAHWITYDSNE